ncbi:DUF4249 domain-containing protein [Labilibaculum antarcticum]|uniref:DUF4249 domain-containing protein n=1 Tax=Labilibaculum antarcticum TaxID=1717717 RepID=A0A1Y1CKX4_9BACT|nr:DUF4249 domain-containing protein [Labilibaculum antarcticum]BAX81037.1 hypothetical protein ALGA_2725 [Labilibaculum antarcticum]
MKYILYISILISVAACTEEIDVKLDDGETRLSVEAKVTSDLKKHFVKLKESSDVFYSEEAIAVSNATITVNDGSNIYEYTEREPGYYESNVEFAGQEGKTYSLSIGNVDIDKDGTIEDYLASSTMKPPYAVDSVKLHFDPDHETRGDEEDKGEFWLLSLYMKDNIETEDYYGFASQINDVLVHDTITELLVQKDTYFNGVLTKGVDVGEFNQSKPDERLNNLDKITLETYAITKDYYDFVSQLQEMDEGQSMFSGTPGNIITNISNNAVGFFAVYSISRTTTTVNF